MNFRVAHASKHFFREEFPADRFVKLKTVSSRSSDSPQSVIVECFLRRVRPESDQSLDDEVFLLIEVFLVYHTYSNSREGQRRYQLSI
jgi:hypothetical protein